jgi:hypothetical protein
MVLPINLLDGIGNISVGFQSGINYTSNESYNILISNYGTVGNIGVIRISNSDQSTCYISGIYDNMSPIGEVRPLFIDFNGQITIIFSNNTNPIAEIYTENPSNYLILLTVSTSTQLNMPTGFDVNTYFNSPTWGQLEFTGSYARLINVSATINCILDSGTNQLLIFELRVNRVKYSAASVKILFFDNIQYQSVR